MAGFGGERRGVCDGGARSSWEARRTLKAVLIVGIATVLMASSNAGAAPTFSDWAAPVNLRPVVKSAILEQGPAISKDGLSLFLASGAARGGFGLQDLWVSQRVGEDDPWGPPMNLGPTINSAAVDTVPALSRDGHWMFFNSDRPGGFGRADLWASYREHVHDDFAWETAVNLGPGVNSAFLDQGASYFENDDFGVPLLFFGSNRPGGMGASDIYVSARLPDGSFGAAQLVRELSSPFQELRPVIRFDGLEMFLFSDRPGTLGDYDLWVSTRRSVSDSWTPPVNLGAPVNSIRADQQAYIASDRRTLYFASARPGGMGGLDLYVTTRARSGP